jgi:hypothetical protein
MRAPAFAGLQQGRIRFFAGIFLPLCFHARSLERLKGAKVVIGALAEMAARLSWLAYDLATTLIPAKAFSCLHSRFILHAINFAGAPRPNASPSTRQLGTPAHGWASL